MRRCLVHHPRRYAGARPVRLRNDDELDAAIGESPDYQYGLAAPGMERIVDPPLDRVFVGSLSLFRAEAEPLEGYRSFCRSAPPSSGALNVCRRPNCRAPHSRPRHGRCERIAPVPEFDLRQPIIDRGPGLLYDFELDRSPCLFLDHG